MARRDIPALVDLLSYEWARQDARKLHRTLCDAYSSASDEHVRLLVLRSGFPPTELRFGQVNRTDLWTEILDKTPPAGRFRPLVLEVLDDEAVAAYHPEIRELATGRPPAEGDEAASEPEWQGSPYPGLEPFTAEMAPVFCGRDAEVRELLRRMAEPESRFVAVMGASGSGKSSLVRAGLIPRLRDDRGWIVVTCRPATWGLPVESLRHALANASDSLSPKRILALIEAGDTVTVRDALLGDDADAGAEALVFVDQFEELFTLVEEEDRGVFLKWLALASKTPGMRVVLAMRNDLMGAYMKSPLLTDLMQGCGYLVKPPDALARAEMIAIPARRAGMAIDDGLVDAIRRDTGDEPGSLALMAFALAELYRAGKEEARLRMEDYVAMGGVAGALERQADDIYAYAAERLADTGADPEEVFGAVFRKLARVNADNTITRARVSRRQLRAEHGEAADRLIDAFVGGEVEEGVYRPRLLTTDEAGPQGDQDERHHASVEVAHERLFTSWPRLAALVQDSLEDHHVLRQVEQDAAEWDREGRPTDRLLWRHERQLDARRMVAHLGESVLGERERAFLTPEWQRLIARLEDLDLSHWERLRIGDRLAEIGGERGDPRPGVGLRADGLPDVTVEGYWREVPPGEVKLEDGHGVKMVANPFWIARYPITWVQYQCFVDDPAGHGDDRWWRDLQHDSAPTNPRFRVSNRPATEVSWYDAVAFCRWLNDRLGLEPDSVRLPTEEQWQLAAGGGRLEEREYPWPGRWDERKANTAEAGLGQTCAVGLYPRGVAGCGALDMAGNVWEWCLNEHADPTRIGIGGTAARVLRGGSWVSDLGGARASCRGWDGPSVRGGDGGFRVVVSSPISE